MRNPRHVRSAVSGLAASRLLTTWIDVDDDAAPILISIKDHAANFNAFTVAEAVNRRFHLPGIAPRMGIGSFSRLDPASCRAGAIS
jgi:hypothetical protein